MAINAKLGSFPKAARQTPDGSECSSRFRGSEHSEVKAIPADRRGCPKS
jgi:hypothetical protein